LLLLPLVLAVTLQAQRGGERQQDTDAPRPAKKKPHVPEPRAIAVLEWVAVPPAPLPPVKAAAAKSAKALPTPATIAPSKNEPPKEARLVPVSIYYDGDYQDAGVYLSQPTPLALRADTVYELEQAGKPEGTFTLQTASRSRDNWLAFGNYKPVPPPKPFKPNVNIALGPHGGQVDEDDDDSDTPVLKRRHPDSGTATTGTATTGTTTTAGKPSQTSGSGPVGSDDPDRPTLKRHDASTTTSGGSQAPEGSNDPDRPVLHRAPASSSEAKGTVAQPRSSDDYLNPADDPARPHIRRGVFRESNPPLPSLLGNPANLRQTVAVSDAVHTDDHPFAHQWNDDAEHDRAQQAMQQLALAQIAAWQKTVPQPPAPAQKAASPRAGSAHRRAAAPAAKPADPFVAVQFAAFDLAYQDEPTYVFCAQTAATDRSQVFVAVVARPDIYGNLAVVFSSMTSGMELELTPRYRLVDAVDANGDGRAELLMESRNLDGRRFVLLDVYRGQAQKVFETGLLP
jgi:hypothetical protein